MVFEFQFPVESMEVADFTLEHESQRDLLGKGPFMFFTILFQDSPIQFQQFHPMSEVVVFLKYFLIEFPIETLIIVYHFLLPLYLFLQTFLFILGLFLYKGDYSFYGPLGAVLDQETEDPPDVTFQGDAVTAQFCQQAIEAIGVDIQSLEDP